MMPNIDPKQIKSIMDRMGMKSTQVDAEKVVIHCTGKDIVIEEPQVTMIEMQGNKSFQVTGIIRDEAYEQPKMEITEEDMRLVKEKTGIVNEDQVRQALEASDGDIAGAIIRLKEEQPTD